jgi:heme-degrading monooxygenase HmoA
VYEIFTYGRFEVEPENEDAFIAAWSELAAFGSNHAGAISMRLVRDVRNAGRFVSFAQWHDAEAVLAFKSSAEFKQRLGRVVSQAKEFEPTELTTLLKATNGTVEALSPPELEPIHAPT